MAKIVVLVGSVRVNGNTDILAQAFVKRAKEANEVEVIHVGKVNVNGCIGCNFCYRDKDNNCCQKDDMQDIYSKMSEADILVFATPVYFYGVSSQLKAVIDRLHNPIRNNFKVKKLVLLSVAADTIPTVFDSVKTMYNFVLNYFNLEDGGTITVHGVQEKGDIKGNPALVESYELGRRI